MLEHFSDLKDTRQRKSYWDRIADQEFYSMDDDAQAQWRELR